MSPEPLVSCLCVTEGRPAFMPWLFWSYAKQTWQNKELIIVDSSPVPYVAELPNVHVLAAPAGTNVPAKRNQALRAARGELIAWFDDDDWQHPQRIERSVAGLRPELSIVGTSRSWFVDLYSLACRRYDGRGSLIFNTGLFRAALARRVAFDETRRRASDTPWLQEIINSAGRSLELVADDSLCFWLSHEQNISNPRSRRWFDLPLEILREKIGTEAWADTDSRLAELRARLPPPSTESRETSAFEDGHGTAPHSNQQAIRNRRSARLPRQEMLVPGPVEVQTAVLDWPLSDVPCQRPAPSPAIVEPVGDVELILVGTDFSDDDRAHVIRQARYPFVGIRALPSLDDLSSALENGTSDYVAVVTSSVFFWTGGTSWIREGVLLLCRDTTIVTVSTHPGMPVGPIGTPRSVNAKLALSWDGRRRGFVSLHPPLYHYIVRRADCRGPLPKDGLHFVLADRGSWAETHLPADCELRSRARRAVEMGQAPVYLSGI